MVCRFAIFAALILLSGCASTLKGTTQEVDLRSVPTGATVAVSGQTATTPVKFKLKRNQDHVATFTKDGYPERQAHLKQRVNGAFYGNLAVGGIVGMAVDMGNGAAYDLSPSNIEMNMATGVMREFEDGETVLSTADAPSPTPMVTSGALAAAPPAAPPPSPAAPTQAGTAGLGTGAPPVVKGVVYHPDTGKSIDCQVLLAWKLEDRADGAKSAAFNREVGGSGSILTGLTPQQLTLGMAMRDACQQAAASR